MIAEQTRLTTIQCGDTKCNPAFIVDELKRDQVVMVQDTSATDADSMVSGVAIQLGIIDQLELQAGYASLRGHRDQASSYFMTVDRRSDYQFLISHSEGDESTSMQFACFYCHENSTDGGVTILQNVDENSQAWNGLRQQTFRVDLCGLTLSAADIAMLKAVHLIDLPSAILNSEDEIIKEIDPPIAGIRRFVALSTPKSGYSKILKRDVRACWENVSNPDFSSGEEYLRMLRDLGLLREHADFNDISRLEYTYPSKVYRSGVKYSELFKARIVHKLQPGEMVIQNNLTWTHSATNWTPGSGERRIVAAFA